MKKSVSSLYEQFYRSIGFERRELFQTIQKEYHPQTVLYPGSSIHITPSLYFPHVVYVDKSVMAGKFFADQKEVSALIAAEKTYKKHAYFEFLAKDFQNDLGLREKSFDLLISLFSGTQIPYCERYVKKGGLILTSSFFSDYEAASGEKELELLCSIRCDKGKVHLHPGGEPPKGPSRSRLKKLPRGFTYYDDETYYLYRKMR